MRLRNIPGADEVVSNSPYCIQNATEYKGKWNELLGNSNPIHIEVGMGKGRFLMELAALHPDINYIGIERYTSVLLRAVQKMEELMLPNVHFLCIDAATLPEIFGKGEVARIYLNFSDPWPKDRHAKRRLTSSEFLARYDKFLAPDGRIEFKTDTFTRDLHHDPVLNDGNIMTEYEEKFSSIGNPICKLIASR